MRRSASGAARTTAAATARWRGDVVAPLIRDLGAALAMRPDAETVRDGPERADGQGRPADGRQGPAHRRLRSRGSCPPTAPLAISTLTVAGMAMAFARDGTGRVAVSFIGEGGTSLGEWHEAINLVRRAPAAGDLLRPEQPDGALARRSPTSRRSRVFADKAAGYGIPGITIDGTDPDAIAAAFAWAAERARAGKGPALIELVCDAHVRPRPSRRHALPRQGAAASWDYPPLTEQGYADRELYEFWSRARSDRDATPRGSRPRGSSTTGDLERVEGRGRGAGRGGGAEGDRRALARPGGRGRGVFAGEPPRARGSRCSSREARRPARPGVLLRLEPRPPFDPKGKTFLEAVMLGVGDALAARPARLRLRRGRRRKVRQRVPAAAAAARRSSATGSSTRRSPKAAVLGVCVGAALAGQRPIGEMQFNDFVATGFNQLVNNAAKIRYRWGGVGADGRADAVGRAAARRAVPQPEHRAVVLPDAGAEDRRPVDAARRARADGGGGRRSGPGPLLRAHRALPRSARSSRRSPTRRRRRLPIGKAALRRAGRATWRSSRTAPTCTSRCASPRRSRATASRRRCSTCASLAPLDREALLALARHCSRVLIVHEDIAHRRDRREPRGDHPGGGVRVARRAGPHRRRARHAGAVLAAARGGVPAERGGDSAGGAAAGRVLIDCRLQIADCRLQIADCRSLIVALRRATRECAGIWGWRGAPRRGCEIGRADGASLFRRAKFDLSADERFRVRWLPPPRSLATTSDSGGRASLDAPATLSHASGVRCRAI